MSQIAANEVDAVRKTFNVVVTRIQRGRQVAPLLLIYTINIAKFVCCIFCFATGSLFSQLVLLVLVGMFLNFKNVLLAFVSGECEHSATSLRILMFNSKVG